MSVCLCVGGKDVVYVRENLRVRVSVCIEFVYTYFTYNHITCKYD